MPSDQPVLSPAIIQRTLRFAVISFFLLMAAFSVAILVSGSDCFDDNTNGEIAPLPIAYRMLVRTTADELYNLVPTQIEKPLAYVLNRWSTRRISEQLFHFDRENLPACAQEDRVVHTFVTMGVIYLTLLAFLAMLYRLTLDLLPFSRQAALVAPFLALILIPALNRRYGYTYDFAELFFVTACLWTILHERWRLYLLAIAVGTFNKETIIFSTFFFAMWSFKRMPRAQFIQLFIAQIVIFVAIKAGLAVYYADRPVLLQEGQYDWKLKTHIFYAARYHYFALTSLLMTLAILLYRWWEKPVFLRAGVWLIAINFVAYVMTCHVGEYRDFYESLPVMILMATHSLVRFTQINIVGEKKANP